MVKLCNSIVIRILSVICAVCFAVCFPIIFVFSSRFASADVVDILASDSSGVLTSADSDIYYLDFNNCGGSSAVSMYTPAGITIASSSFPYFSFNDISVGIHPTDDYDKTLWYFDFRSIDYFSTTSRFGIGVAPLGVSYAPLSDEVHPVYNPTPSNFTSYTVNTPLHQGSYVFNLCIFRSSSIAFFPIFVECSSYEFLPQDLWQFNSIYVAFDDSSLAFEIKFLPDFSNFSDVPYTGYRIFEYRDTRSEYFRISIPVCTSYTSSYLFVTDSLEGNSYEDGYDDGYNAGFSSGESLGYSKGESAGQTVGYSNGYKSGQSDGYSTGFSAGIASANEYTFLGLIGAVIDAPIKAVTSLLDFEVLGFNMSSFALSLLTICVLLKILSLVSGG